MKLSCIMKNPYKYTLFTPAMGLEQWNGYA
jgi:hypothetical protein